MVIIQGARGRGNLYCPRLTTVPAKRGFCSSNSRNTTIIISSHPELTHGNVKRVYILLSLLGFSYCWGCASNALSLRIIVSGFHTGTSVRLVRPALFSQVSRPLSGPGAGTLVPAPVAEAESLSAVRMVLIDSGVRSS